MSWWDTGWSYRFKYEIPNANLPDGESLTDFPLHIDLTNDAPAEFWTHVKSDGSDIRVVDNDDSTQLTGCHLEGWDYANQKGHLWVKKTIAQDTGANTDCVYVYYGNAGASADWGKAGTYKADYKAVWHLDETTGHYLDATSNNNDSTAEDVTSRTAAGKIDNCPEFDGSSDEITITENGTLDFTKGFAIKAWIYPHTTSDAHTWVGKRTNYRIAQNGQKLLFTNFGIKDYTTAGNYITAANQWYDIVVVFDDSDDVLFYVNGEWKETITGTADCVPCDTPLTIGQTNNGSNYFDGLIDEVRILGAIPSAEWIAFAHLSDKGDAGTAGAEESAPVAAKGYAFLM